MNKKYSFIIEGETEDKVIKSIKTDLIEAKKLIICKQHSDIIRGAPNIDNIINTIIDTSNCCHKFVIIDKDDVKDEKINKLKNTCDEKKSTLIISRPLFEINLLAFFENINTKLQKDDIYNKLKKYTKINDYKAHKIKGAEKIIVNIKKENKLKEWIDKLIILKEKGISNFIDFIDLLLDSKKI